MSYSRVRVVGFAIVTALSVGVAAWYFFRAVRRTEVPERAEVAASSGPSISTDVGGLATVVGEPHVLFRNTAFGESYGHVAVATLREPAGARFATALECERVDFAGGFGVCLVADRGVFTTYKAEIFDASFTPSHTVPLAGVPSRVRVAHDGSVAAVTVFVSGHAYEIGGFSTQTTLIETRTGTTIANLEDFAVTRGGKPFKATNFNFWGVTFSTEPNVFFATLNTGSVFYLVRGDTVRKVATVVGEGVECPSLSPDATRIAFKKRVTEGGRLIWHLAIRTLETGKERVLTEESRSIDDQVEWLDNDNILYGAPDDELGPGRASVWVLNAGGGPPRKWLTDAFSPSVF